MLNLLSYFLMTISFVLFAEAVSRMETRRGRYWGFVIFSLFWHIMATIVINA